MLTPMGHLLPSSNLLPYLYMLGHDDAFVHEYKQLQGLFRKGHN